MAKRFHDTEIWSQDWFLEMPFEYQFFWFYVKDTCDHAGIWKPHKKVFEQNVGKTISYSKAIELFNSDKERVRVLKNGRWFLPDFFVFQYGPTFNIDSRVHSSIKTLLTLNCLDLTSIRGLIDLKDRVKDKDKERSLKQRYINNKVIEGDAPRFCHTCERYFYNITETNFEKHLTKCRRAVV